jgi:hypothetical protein
MNHLNLVSDDFHTQATLLQKHASKVKKSISKLPSASGQLSVSSLSVLWVRNAKLLWTLHPFGRTWYWLVSMRSILLMNGGRNFDHRSSMLDPFFGAAFHRLCLYLRYLLPSSRERTPIASALVLGSCQVLLTMNDAQMRDQIFSVYSKSYHMVLVALNFQIFSVISLATVKRSYTVQPLTCVFVLQCFYGDSYPQAKAQMSTIISCYVLA